MKKINSSWQKVSPWYKRIVGQRGHSYHQDIIIPRSLKLLNLKKGDSLLDLACGNGVLERYIPKEIPYLGVDLAKDLIFYAQSNNKSKFHKFQFGDITRPIRFDSKFSKAVIILALQNVLDQLSVIKNAKNLLLPRGHLLIVLNHPFYRIPKNSFWQEDKKNNAVYRMVTKYMSVFEEEILANPSKAHKSEATVSRHFSLSYITQILTSQGFSITGIEEWVSEKKSLGSNAKAENKARKEFPMFMAINVKLI